MGIKLEVLRGKRYFVARNKKGQFVSRRQQAGSNITLSQAKDIFRENRTFYPDRRKDKVTLTNFNEITISSPSSISKRYDKPIKRPSRGDKYLYNVSGIYKGKMISASSKALTFYNSANDAKAAAWESFLERLSQSENRSLYDADEGIKLLSEVKGLREGWIIYVTKNP